MIVSESTTSDARKVPIVPNQLSGQPLTDLLHATIIQATLDPLMILDEDGRIIEFNLAAERTFGRSRAEMLGGSPAILLPDHQRAQATEVFGSLQGRSHLQLAKRIELPLERRDGTPVICDLAVSPFHHAERTLRAVNLRDVSEQRRVERELGDKAARLQWLIESTTEAIFRFELDVPLDTRAPEDAQLEHLYAHAYLAEANNAMARMYGYHSGQDMLRLRLAHFLPTEDPRNLAMLRAFIRSDYRLIDAHSVDVDRSGRTHDKLSCLYGEVHDGLGYRAWGTSRDVTEHTRAELALRDSEERLRLAMVAGDLGVWDVDPGSGAVICSARARDMLGIAEDVVLGRDFLLQAVVAEDRPRAQRALERALDPTGGGDCNVEVRVMRPAEDCRWVAVRGKGMFSSRGDLLRFTGVVLDVTARQAIQTALVSKTRQLEKANAELARSNDELEQFAYVASHDLQEPLRMVANYLGLLERRLGSRLGEEAAEYVRESADGARRMQALIRGLLEYSRVGVNRTPQATSVDAAVDVALANLVSKIDASSAEIRRTPLPRVVVDPSLLAQVFQNLIANAIKFCQRRPIIELRGEVRAGDCLLAVSDNGIGIDPALHDQLFQLFRRLHTRDEYPGTGIGLALVKKIIERHGGRVWLESTPGSGTTFWFTLPRAD